MGEPLIELTRLRREFPAGDQVVVALDDVTLTIESGEMVAIVGASGSGKSTLMNILGCLDRATAGSYRIAGRDTAALEPDELAELRREHFGFIFQRYHLMSDLSALDNVEVPAVYAGRERGARKRRAEALLERLGLTNRMDHRPSQLSGGQQQRVSIARALMNGGEIILADEPTGALDSKTGAEMMQILEELNAEGHTIILVTHDIHVAEHARRIIEIRDGRIIADRPTPRAADHKPGASKGPMQADLGRHSWTAVIDRVGEAFRMAVLAMNAHRMRTFLTMLGIIIGIASVVSVVALGEGARSNVLKNISAIGTNTIDIFPGRGFGDEKAATVQTLIPADADALAQQSYVDSVTPTISTSVSIRYGSVSATGSVNGVGDQYFRVRDVKLAQGAPFGRESVEQAAQEIVIDDNTRKKLFGDLESPVGKVVILGKMPARVIGVAEKKDSAFGPSQNLVVFAPYTTVMGRMLGRPYLQGITVRVKDDAPTDVAETAITRLMTLRHGSTDITLFNSDNIRQTVERTTGTLTLLIAAIAVISLVVGGIGVMNIMLVSVSERTKEIGVRSAVGARRSDILIQFLIEAVLVCLLGGGIGVLLAYGLASLFTAVAKGAFVMSLSLSSVIAAFAFSTLIGVVFGFMPARNAARLDPIEALARE